MPYKYKERIRVKAILIKVSNKFYLRLVRNGTGLRKWKTTFDELLQSEDVGAAMLRVVFLVLRTSEGGERGGGDNPSLLYCDYCRKLGSNCLEQYPLNAYKSTH